MGTGWVLPTCPRLPTPSMVSAAEPVVGQGREGEGPGMCTDVVTTGWKTGGGDASGPLETHGHAEESDQEGQAERYGQSAGLDRFSRPGNPNCVDAHARGPGGSWTNAS